MHVGKSDDLDEGIRPNDEAERGRREGALNGLRNLGWILPPGHRFSRDEANQRGQGNGV